MSQAVAVASVITDRICIKSNGTIKPEISAKYLMACDDLSSGCISGFPYYGFLYWRHHGIATGGEYGSNVVSDYLIYSHLITHPDDGTDFIPYIPSSDQKY